MLYAVSAKLIPDRATELRMLREDKPADQVRRER
jgi:hypothetical protein